MCENIFGALEIVGAEEGKEKENDSKSFDCLSNLCLALNLINRLIAIKDDIIHLYNKCSKPIYSSTII